MKTYTYAGYYFDIETQEPLLDEGILNGQYGTLHFRRCADGYAIYNSSFMGSGLVSTPTAANIAYPNCINGIPVTEIHNSIQIDFNNPAQPIAIEGHNLKRVYLYIGRKPRIDNPYEDDGLAKLVMSIMDSMDRRQADSDPPKISIDFYNEDRAVDFCEIRIDETCILRDIASKRLEVLAPSVILVGQAYRSLEYAKFSGRVYPDRAFGEQYTDYFENVEVLRFVDGSLGGDVCWSFNGCKLLERVHLASGMQAVPPRAFANCSSLTDLYIPDTVSQIGEYAFANCTKLAKIHLPSNIKKIPKGLFMNCCSLEKCYLSDSIEEIEGEAFIGCTALRKPWIPKEIKKIDATAFDDPSWGKIF